MKFRFVWPVRHHPHGLSDRELLEQIFWRSLETMALIDDILAQVKTIDDGVSTVGREVADLIARLPSDGDLPAADVQTLRDGLTAVAQHLSAIPTEPPVTPPVVAPVVNPNAEPLPTN